MAKLLSYYRLCPLIDTRQLLGISEDTEKGIVLVTLGRNIAIKYRLSDQKQLCSWRSKEKFTSPVYYDKKLEKYVAVFNESFIRTWTEEDETLDKVKKYKFEQLIETVFTHKGESFILFKTGSVYPLNDVLESRKTFIPTAVIEDAEICDILHVSLDDDLYLGILTKNNGKFILYWTVYTYYSKNMFSKNQLHIENTTLQGCTLYISNKSVRILTVWSDGNIYTKELVRHDKEESDIGELFTVLENISVKHLVRVMPLDDKYIAFYGSDPNEEGAILLIYNTQFKVTQSKQIHKLYTNDAKMWKTYNCILLPVGQNLVVVPFNLESEQLAALIGSHKPVQTKIDSDISVVTEFEVANWDEENTESEEKVLTKLKKKQKKVQSKTKSNKELPLSLKNKVAELFKEGLPEAIIIEQMLPEILDQEDVTFLADSLKYFTDIPESFLAKILKFTLSCDKKKFTKSTDQKFQNLPEELLPNERVVLLDKVLTRNFSETLLLPYLRTELSVDQATVLLQYLIYQFSDAGHNLPTLNALRTEKCVINWISLVIDSNYQKFVLSKDDKIEEVLVKCKSIILDHVEAIDDLKRVIPDLARVEEEIKGKNYASGRLANSMYSIEQIEL